MQPNPGERQRRTVSAAPLAEAARESIATESRASIVGRRLVTLPLYFALCLLLAAVLPLLLPLAAVFDAVRRSNWATVRCLLFFLLYLACETMGILASFALWLAVGVGRGRWSEPYQKANFTLQCWWATLLLRGAQKIFALRLHVEGDEATKEGPFFLFLRHASVGDTVLAANFVAARHGIRLRYVLKRELLWDPCLDIVGNRLPNCFVQRGSGDSAREIAAVRRLARGLGPRDGVLIYPEGTRFTAAKRDRVLQRLASSATPEMVARASALRYVLPPRLGGVLGLLEEGGGIDVVFCAHCGFDGVASFADLINGALIGRTIRIGFWRVPGQDLPRAEDDRANWLYDQWERMDDWVSRNRQAETPS
jgi:1-acyl-sn-glycerol-3-phosphate acyltransferase